MLGDGSLRPGLESVDETCGVVDCVGGNYGINVVTTHHNLNYLPSWLELVERESTLKKRKHHDMIVQWAKDDSLEVEASRNDSGIWFITECPSWCENLKYRFKPKTKQVTISEIKAVFGDDIEIVGD